ncbi:MAG: hypothetical protein LBG06_06440, partial [Deltaproteobacteria bacterium]|nr:hypothetical protein [Deltaproteobacteria bacterium]
VVVWTPFRSKGNPFRLPKLPNLQALMDDEEDLDLGLETATLAALRLLDIARKPRTAETHVLKSAFRAILKAGDAPSPARLLQELKSMVASADKDERAEARGFYRAADFFLESFASARRGDPRLEDDSSNDLSELFSSGSGRTRVSVMSLTGQELEFQRNYLERLLMALFTHITEESRSGGAVRGLLVIDEAKEFVPSDGRSTCKMIIRRFTSMARKYNYGIVLASQELKSMDSRTVNNCTTKLFGKQTANAAVKAAEEIMGTGNDLRLAHLGTGQFYLKSDSAQGPRGEPLRVTGSLCLTWHPSGSPDRDEILRYAAESAGKAARRGDA